MIREHHNDEVIRHFLSGDDSLRLTKNLVSVGGYLFSYGRRIGYWSIDKKQVNISRGTVDGEFSKNIDKHIYLVARKCVSYNMRWEWIWDLK